MELDAEQRKAIVAMCCSVARADGEVTPGEFEALLDILSRFASGVVGFGELQQWLADGPPDISARLPGESIRPFVHEAVAVANADGTVDDSEVKTIKAMVARYFEEGDEAT